MIIEGKLLDGYRLDFNKEDKLTRIELPNLEERKQGEWIDTGYHQYYNDGEIETTELKCPCCNEVVEWDILLSHKPYYCENCGADMRDKHTEFIEPKSNPDLPFG